MRAAKLLALAAGLCAAGASGAAPDDARIVILPVVVHSAAPDPGYVSQGLSEMLSARLEQLGGVHVVRAEEPALATTRLEEAVRAAGEAGGDYVLFGSFTQFGDGASLDIRCAPVRGGTEPPGRNIFIQSGSMGEIIPKLDDLADKVARYVHGEAPAESAPSSRNGSADARALEELSRRLEALEQAVFAPVAGAAGEVAPATEIAEESPEP